MKRFRVLSIDGGGIRGVIPALWLSRIANQIEGPLVEKFDLIVGTSTGSILASALSLEKNVEDWTSLYDQFGSTIFPRSFRGRNGWSMLGKIAEPEYSDKPLANVLQRLFAIDTKMSDCVRPTIIVTYDVFSRSIYLIRSYDRDTCSIPVWEACKSSSSAPTYFPAHILKIGDIRKPLIDGGVFANNPSTLAISEAIRLQKKDSIKELHQDTSISLISLGTGKAQRSISLDDAQRWGAAQWLKPIIDVAFDSSSEHSNFCAHQILTSRNYVRLQVDLNNVSDDLDDSSAENINELKQVADAYINSIDGQAKLDKILELLSD